MDSVLLQVGPGQWIESLGLEESDKQALEK